MLEQKRKYLLRIKCFGFRFKNPHIVENIFHIVVPKGFVYLICDAEKDLYKIGVTKGSVEGRLKELQTGNGGELHIVHVQQTDKPFKMETMLHNRFKLANKHGEWFELSPEEVIEFAKYCELCQKNIDALKENPFFK